MPSETSKTETATKCRQQLYVYTIPERLRTLYHENTGQECPKTIGMRDFTLQVETFAVQRAIDNNSLPAMEMVKASIAKLDNEAVSTIEVDSFFNKAPKALRDLIRDAWAIEAHYTEADEKDFFGSKTRTF